jgi:eukaryotic-like serine/threonine-protein kinase
MGDRGPVEDVRPFAELSRSSTAVVYKAYQASHERVVLLKRLLPEVVADSRVVERFADESRLIARIDHRNVVALYAIGQEDDAPYLIAEFVDGLNLAELIARGPIPAPLAVFILRESVRGIGAAHDRGILHRDIKPANVLISFDGAVKVTDFGFASLIDAGDEHALEVRGTLPYLAPEQVTGDPPTVGTDLFALGATFFEMLTGRRAFLGSEPGTILEAILHYDPVPQLAGRSDLSAEVIAIGGRLLTRFAEERYDNWADVESDCTAYLAGFEWPVDEAVLASFVEDASSFKMPAEASPSIDEPVSVREREPRRREWRIALPAVMLLLTMLFAVAALSGVFSPIDRSDPVAALEDAQYPLWLYPLGPDGREVEAEEDETEGETEAEAPVDNRGALRISVDPWATVVVGRDTLGRTPLADRIYIAPGQHRLTFLHPEFPAVERTVNVREGGDQAIRVSMWESVGQLTIEVSPWAAVFIDGVPRDTIPPQERPYVLAPGRYRLSLDHPVLGRYDTEVRLGAGERRTLRFNLYDLLR